MTALTSNPTIFDKAIKDGTAYVASWQDLLARIGARHKQLSR